MYGRKYMVLLLAALLALPGVLRGQCPPLPLPYETDLQTGFQPPANTQSPFMFPWREVLNRDNCWTGYLDYGDDYSYDDAPYHYNSAQGRFGYILYYSGATEWMEAEIAVKDSTHNAVAMIIAPRFDNTPAAIRLTVKLQRWVAGSYTGDALYWVHVDVGWVTDVEHPDESFLQTGSFALRSHHLMDTCWDRICLPVHDEVPTGGSFALRLRSKAQGPAQNWVPSDHFFYELMFRRMVADTAVCPPPLAADTVYVADSVCQHSPYRGNGIALSASVTADTGTRAFVLHDYEYYSPDSCLVHVKVLTLRVLPSDVTIVEDSIFPGEAYLFGGRELTLAGGYADDHGLNAYGCPVKDSLELSIRPLPPMDCGAEIGVERTEWYISQPTEVSLWAEVEADSYRWSPASLIANDTARNVSLTLQPESEQWVHLEVERTDSVNHIHRGDAMDTTVQMLQLTVPVEPQTRYRLEATLGDGGPVPVQVAMGNTLLLDSTLADGSLLLELSTSQHCQITLTILAQQPVRMTDLSLRRYCHAEDSVLLVARSVQPVVEAEREVLCQGDSTTLRASQTDYFRWASRPEDTTLESQQGRPSVTVHPQSTTTYYLLTRGGDVADSVVITVQAYPELQPVADREAVDFDHPVLTLEELSPTVALVQWSFSDGGEAEGRKVRWCFGDVAEDSLWVREMGCTVGGCCADTLLVFPVETVSVWFPNAFTPDGAENSRFAMVTNREVEAYEMTLYNREGLLVARITDAAAGWDGRDLRGAPCPQGAYAYLCEYRLAGGATKRYLGTVLLLR